MKKLLFSILFFAVTAFALHAQTDQPAKPADGSMSNTFFLTGGAGLVIILIAVMVRRRRKNAEK